MAKAPLTKNDITIIIKAFEELMAYRRAWMIISGVETTPEKEVINDARKEVYKKLGGTKNL